MSHDDYIDYIVVFSPSDFIFSDPYVVTTTTLRPIIITNMFTPVSIRFNEPFQIEYIDLNSAEAQAFVSGMIEEVNNVIFSQHYSFCVICLSHLWFVCVMKHAITLKGTIGAPMNM